MKKILLVFFLALMFQACKEKRNEFVKAEGGLLYLVHEHGSGRSIMPGDFTVLHVIEQTEEGKVLYNSSDFDGRPIYRFREPSLFKGDFFTGMGYLSEGDSATFKVNLDSLIRKKEIAQPKTSGRYLVYHIKVHQVIARDNLNDSLFNEKIAAFKTAAAEQAKSMEAEKIRRYIKRRKLHPLVSPSGLYYIQDRKGDGLKGKPGDTALVNFTASYLNGRVFETSSRETAGKSGLYNPNRIYGPAKFLINKIPASGFGEALASASRGAKMKLIIPSKLAYGNKYYRELGPYTPLLCDLEILAILKPKQNNP